MTFEKTLFLSVLFHAVILAALTITLKKPFIIPKPFQVSLVSPYTGRFKKKEANSAAPEKPLVRPSKAPVPASEKRSAMAMEPEKKAVRPSRENNLISQELAKIQQQVDISRGLAQVKSRVRKLSQKLTITKKDKKPASGGGATSGNGSSTPLQAYESLLVQRIWSNWYFPDQRTHGIQAIVTIDVLADGTIVYKGFEKHSGNSLLDSSAVRAIQRAGKVPPPPYPLEIGVIFNPD